MKEVLLAFSRALIAQCTPRMLLLTVIPFLFATLLWGSLLWLGLQSFIDAIQHYFAVNDGYAVSAKWLGLLGLAALKTIIVPLLAMWALLPLMVATALIFVGTMAMPAIVRHVAKRRYPALERRRGGSFATMLWVTLSSLCIFVALWIVTTPLCALPLVGFLIQPLLWGWLSFRLFSYDVLADYADVVERRELMRRHRWALLGIGTSTGILGIAPSLLWLGGVPFILLFPVFATLSIWLYMLVCTFSGLWFTYYGLAALEKYRIEAG